MKIQKTSLPGVLLIEPTVFADGRGWFTETYNAGFFVESGLPETFVQDNHSQSNAGVLRGLHYQLERPQGKLVRCARGTIRDVAVDIRRSSPNFGQWVSADLSAENRLMLWVPPQFAHGFAVLGEEVADVLYKCTTLRHAESERSILWNDPAIGIEWGVEAPTVSTKDAAAALLRDAQVYEP